MHHTPVLEKQDTTRVKHLINFEKRKALDFHVKFFNSSVTVCGSDGVTYTSVCTFLSARKSYSNLMLASPSPCDAPYVEDDKALVIFKKLYDRYCKESTEYSHE